jgi:tetratricopeptide (TPR) repeat protein
VVTWRWLLWLLPVTLCAQQLAEQAVEAERNGHYAEAISDFEQLLRSGADSPALRSNLGIAYFQAGDYPNALQQLRLALRAEPGSVPANLFAGLSLLKLQRPREAVVYLQKAHQAQPNDTMPVLALARAEAASNELTAARASYENATHLDPQSAEAWYGLGITERALAEKAKSRALLSASEQAMAKGMQLEPNSVHAHMILGECFRIAERYDLAVGQYKEAVAQQPDSAQAWAGLAAAYSAAGDDDRALETAGRALALDPNDAETNALVAGTYLRKGNPEKAESYAARALELHPGLAGAQIVLAKIYLSRRQPQKAVEQLQTAVCYDTDGNAYYLLATALRELGRQTESAAAMQKFKQLHAAHAQH